MTQDVVNRRGGGTAAAATKSKSKASRHSTAPDAAKQAGETSTQSEVVQDLQDAMPKLLLRLFLSTLLFACIAAGAAFYMSSASDVPQSLASDGGTSNSDSVAVRLLPAAKIAQSPAHVQRTGTPSVHVLAKYPHDPEAFTQGLLVVKQGDTKFFIESTGLFGKSSLRKVDIETGAVLGKYNLPKELFGEGVTLTSDSSELVMLTWKNRKGLVFQARSGSGSEAFALQREFEFDTVTGEGWGIDSDGSHLVVSDGSATLMFWDLGTMKEARRVEVTFRGHAIAQLNELEVANGFVYANIWYEKLIAKIDPATGEIVAVFDCSALVTAETTGNNQGAVLNGIAYDGDDDAFYLTGKLWNAVYKVRLLE